VWMSPNATRATEKRRSNTVHVAKCHACHATASRGPARGPAATTHPAAPPEASVYCACHTTASRGPATTTRAAAPPGNSVNRACHTTASRVHQLLQEALCTACLSHLWRQFQVKFPGCFADKCARFTSMKQIIMSRIIMSRALSVLPLGVSKLKVVAKLKTI